MCEQCVVFEKLIGQYRRIQRSVTDPKMIACAEQLISEFQADKAALHADDPPVAQLVSSGRSPRRS